MYNSEAIYRTIKMVQRAKNSRGTFVGAVNATKTNPERKWSFKLGVTKHLKGGKPSYNRFSRGHLGIWCTTRNAYRTIDCRTLKHLRTAKVDIIKDGQLTEKGRLFYNASLALIELKGG